MSTIDDRIADVFRDVYERIDTEVREAPEWSTIPKPGIQPSQVWRGSFIAAAVAAAILVVVGVTSLVVPWQRSATSPVGGADIEGVVVAVYLADDIDAEQLAVVTEALTTAPGVIDWRYIDKAGAYEKKVVEWADREDYIEILRDNPDVLPASIRLLTANQTDAKAIEMLIRGTLPMPTSGIMGFAVARGTLSEVEWAFGYDGNSPFAALDTIAEGWVAVALLDSGITADQRQRVIDTLSTQRGVIEVLYVDKATALEEALVLFASDPAMIRVLEENPYLLPASIRVLTQAKRQADAIVSAADTLTGVIKTAVYRGALVQTKPLLPPVVDISDVGVTTTVP
jgi:cell division protein FtsX